MGSNRNKPKLNLFQLFLGVCGSPNIFFVRLFRCFRPVSKQPRNKQNLWYGELKKVYILTNLHCCFSWSFVCIGCFETPILPVSILKRNNRNKRLVSDSADTSFGCFDTKLVSEDNLFADIGLTVHPGMNRHRFNSQGLLPPPSVYGSELVTPGLGKAIRNP